MSIGRDLETMVFRKSGEIGIPTGFLQGNPGLFVEDITEALVEKQREDELFVIAGINSAAEQDSRAPQVGFELLLGDAVPRDSDAHDKRPSRFRTATSFSSAANAAAALSRSWFIASSTVRTFASVLCST